MSLRHVARGLGIAILVLLGACLDRGTAPELSADAGLLAAVIVSDPRPATGAQVAPSRSSAIGADSVAYVSLPPGAVPDGIAAEIRNLSTGSSVQAPLTAGGFDPVAVPAAQGDSLEVIVILQGGGRRVVVVTVAAHRPPIVVRTQPPPNKTGVPLNTVVIVVFSEPMDAGTVTPGTFRLLHDRSEVRGVAVVHDDGLTVEFRPDSLLSPRTEYLLTASTGLRDATGDGLAQAFETSFVTGAAASRVAVVRVTPETATVYLGSIFHFVFTALDSVGNGVVGSVRATWSSSDPAIVAVDQTGLVRGMAIGSAEITASVEAVTGQAEVTVRQLSHLQIYPDTFSVPESGTGNLYLEALDSGRVVAVSSLNLQVSISDSSIASVQNGYARVIVTGRTNGRATVVVQGGGQIDSSVVLVEPLRFAEIAAGAQHTCGLTQRGGLFCWGFEDGYVLGQGGFGQYNHSTRPLPVPDNSRFSKLAAGVQHSCVLGFDGVPRCWGVFPITTSEWLLIGGPVSVATQGPLQSVIVGDGHSCALSLEGSAACWGQNSQGQLGDGNFYFTSSLLSGAGLNLHVNIETVPVAGGLTFEQIAAGEQHTCGITTTGLAYCWGDNQQGQLGIGLSLACCSATPIPVLGGLTFVGISAGGNHTCGVASDGGAYCWGENTYGELGDSTGTRRYTPSPVAGGLKFANVSAGREHSCALTESGEAYCWGRNFDGRLGDGTTTLQRVPVAVVGGLRFVSVSTGGAHTCGITTTGVAYCWGNGSVGQLGTDGIRPQLAPAKVWGQP